MPISLISLILALSILSWLLYKIRQSLGGKKWLLVGNGPCDNLDEEAKKADIIIQINDCKHVKHLPAGKTRWVFVTNTGQVFPDIVESIHSNMESLNGKINVLRVILARSPTFYRLKRRIYFRKNQLGDAFYISPIKKYLNAYLCEMPFHYSYRLERKMRSLGMPLHFMPSTGMIAYDWIIRKMAKGDSLSLQGFTFEGWDRHPWDIEKALIIPLKIK